MYLKAPVLGPLLFLIYINDLPNVSDKLKIFLFADDTNIYYESADLLELEKTVNMELQNLSLWLKVNRLALNIDKTNFLIFHSSKRSVYRNVTLKLDKKAICEKTHIKYLGVIIDCQLNWKHHIVSISKKISRGIGVMYRIRNYVDLKVLKSVYYSLIYSHIVYAIEVWGSACITELDNILILQKKAVRMMTNTDQYPPIPGPRNPSNPSFVALEILKIQEVFKLQTAKFIFNCLAFNTPSIFWNWFTPNHQIHTYNSRSGVTVCMNADYEVASISESNILHTHYSKLVNYGAKMLKVSGPLMWNSLPEHIRNSASIFTLKKILKKYFLNQYDTSPIPVSNYYYVSKLSLCLMRLTLTKVYTFFVPPYLPARIPKVRKISNDGMVLKIFQK